MRPTRCAPKRAAASKASSTAAGCAWVGPASRWPARHTTRHSKTRSYSPTTSGPIAAFHLSERLRPDAYDAIAALRADGLDIEIASGDAAGKVAAVAARLGIARWHARQRPADKLARLAALRAEGARVIAIGDGINDAPVLAGADVAVALASGAELAQAASDIVLTGERLGALAAARAVARETLAILRQNQRWALIYNLSVVPLGALGFVPPWLAALGMSVSSLVVVLNALRIGRRGERTVPTAIPHEEAPRMNILVVMIPLSILLLLGAGIAFFWAVDHDQFDDMDTPSLLPLLDEPNATPQRQPEPPP